MNTFHIHIQGQVQGIGFRPHVFRLAHDFQVKGWVSNGMDGVHIEVSGDQKTISDFYEELLNNPPSKAIIQEAQIQEIVFQTFSDFRISQSLPSGQPKLLITPDLGICPDCKKEIHDQADRRFHYAFTTCLQCGPRYSIMQGLPYDRPLTTMQDYKMCPKCAAEYNNPLHRRFYSQTNSCPDCAVPLYWLNRNGNLLSDQPENIYSKANTALHNGAIIAVKGIGGFLLIADATNKEVLQKLRQRKHRPTKPFALLYPNEKMLEADVQCNEVELENWRSVESPIVLFRFKTSNKPDKNPSLASGVQTALIAPGLNRIGAMQPYAPILEILSQKFGKPLVATSGNINGFPIFYKDENAKNYLREIADYFLCNGREIVVPQDDSVIGFCKQSNQKLIFRRSRSLAPNFIHQGFETPLSILSMGALLKSTFALQHQSNTYISQYLGNTANYDVQGSYKNTLNHLTGLLDFKPNCLIIDKHPNYFSSQYGETLAKNYGVSILKIQHHQAHLGAVLAEHDLLKSKEPILGVIWDGTGYGDDGNVWGGEFFIYHKKEFERWAHFDYFPNLAGDKMAKEPRLSALAIAHNIPSANEFLKPKFTEKEWNFYSKNISRRASLKTSSVGRLFDAVASLLGINDHQTFEGEAAMHLQALAEEYFEKEGENIFPYPLMEASPKKLINFILEDLTKGISKGSIAVKFHLTLAMIIRQMALDAKVKKITFSGGVFQNTFLIDLIYQKMGNDFQLFFHQNLSPNDECISFGQLACGLLQLEKEAIKTKTKDLAIKILTQ